MRPPAFGCSTRPTAAGKPSAARAAALRSGRALIALVNQGRAQLGGDTLANTMSDIYRLPASDFHDITTGSTSDGSGLSYASKVGFDQTTGRGTPIANLLVNDLIHSEYLPPPPKVWPIGLGGIVGTGTSSASKAIGRDVTTKPTKTSSVARIARIAAISPLVSRIGHSARPTTLRASDAADRLTEAPVRTGWAAFVSRDPARKNAQERPNEPPDEGDAQIGLSWDWSGDARGGGSPSRPRVSESRCHVDG